MTTTTIYIATCELCNNVRDMLSKSLDTMINTCESIGTARAAQQLAIMGHYDLAKQLVLENKKAK
jgi:hypothetical protein|tara:strand:- start:203 stop:397 length:195 start_codon:yes stop_codon:yes gene_type:complete